MTVAPLADVTDEARRILERAARGPLRLLGGAAEHEEIGRARLDDLRSRIDAEPKGMRWTVRAPVGERLNWFEGPDEVG